MTPVLPSLLAKTIARTLPVTLNPANDHIKAILAKTGTTLIGIALEASRTVGSFRTRLAACRGLC